MGTMIFNGISTEDIGVIIQAPPVYEFPTKKYDVIQIIGKNGDIVIDKNSYNNVNREYNLALVFRKSDTFVENVRLIVDWLSSASGYARLEDSYEPNYFRMAMYRSGGQMTNYYGKATGMIVKFECKPQRFLKSGENSIVFKKSTHGEGVFHKIMNPTKYLALPELSIFNGVETIEIRNGEDVENPDNITILTITEEITDKVVIDSEIQDAYTESSFINSKIQLTNGFPKLYPGTNWIKFSNATDNSEILLKPRWWVL